MFYGNRKAIRRGITLTFDKKKYEIRPIDYKTAMDLVVEFHYLHRKAPCSQAFGLFNTVDISINNLIDKYQTDINFHLAQKNN